MRTLTFGDRTISYDAGLDTINTEHTTPGNREDFKCTHNKHFEEFSEAAQEDMYRSASLQLKI